MFIKILPCSPGHIRQVVFRGSLPMPGSEVTWHHVKGISKMGHSGWYLISSIALISAQKVLF